MVVVEIVAPNNRLLPWHIPVLVVVEVGEGLYSKLVLVGEPAASFLVAIDDV